jgi:hypothetical protein
MTDEELKALEERERQARASSENLEKGVKIAQNIAALQKKDESLQKQISDYVNAPKPEAGAIKRYVGAPFGIINAVSPIYAANESGAIPFSNQYLNTFATQYFKQVRDSIATMVSNKDYLSKQKSGKDMAKVQFGIKNELAATITGLMLDIQMDPMNAVPLTPVFNAVKSVGKFGIEFASKAPKIEKGINALRSRLNLFHDIEKAGSAEDVAKFKKDVQEYISTDNAKVFEKWGYGKQTNPKASLDQIKAEFAAFKPSQNVAKRKELATEINALKDKLKITKSNLNVTENMQKQGTGLLSPDEYTALITRYKTQYNSLVSEIDNLTNARKALAPAAIKKEFSRRMSIAQRDV